jgi:hypothetical protein
MTIRLDTCVRVLESNYITIKIKLEFMYICIRGNTFAPVSTILPLYIAAVLSSKLMFSEN